MKERTKEHISILLTIVVFISMFGGLIYWVTSLIPDYVIEYKTIQGKIIDVEPILNDRGDINYFTITFDNNESYNVTTYKDMDFTMNSEIIIEIQNGYWTDETMDEIWSLTQIVKVPSED